MLVAAGGGWCYSACLLRHDQFQARFVRVKHAALHVPSPPNHKYPTMKLTPELIQSVPSSLNPVKERQLDLRGEHPSYSLPVS